MESGYKGLCQPGGAGREAGIGPRGGAGQRRQVLEQDPVLRRLCVQPQNRKAAQQRGTQRVGGTALSGRLFAIPNGHQKLGMVQHCLACFCIGGGRVGARTVQIFLTQYGSSTYAADVRQRLAACHTETRNTSSSQNSQVEQKGSGEAGNPTAACNQARSDAISRINQTCSQQQARLGPTQVLNQNVENAPSNSAGQAVGNVLGGALFCGRANVNIPSQYECTVSVSGSCQRQITGAQSVDVCP